MLKLHACVVVALLSCPSMVAAQGGSGPMSAPAAQAFTLTAPSIARAMQTGPWMVTFPANPDHAVGTIVTNYELVVTPASGPALAPFNLNKPTPVSGNISVNVDAYISGLAAGTYTAVIRAIGPGGQAVSPASAPFTLAVPAPRPQAAPVVSKS